MQRLSPQRVPSSARGRPSRTPCTSVPPSCAAAKSSSKLCGEDCRSLLKAVGISDTETRELRSKAHSAGTDTMFVARAMVVAGAAVADVPRSLSEVLRPMGRNELVDFGRLVDAAVAKSLEAS